MYLYNLYRVNLMHIFLIGPLLSYIGYYKTNSNLVQQNKPEIILLDNLFEIPNSLHEESKLI